MATKRRSSAKNSTRRVVVPVSVTIKLASTKKKTTRRKRR